MMQSLKNSTFALQLRLARWSRSHGLIEVLVKIEWKRGPIMVEMVGKREKKERESGKRCFATFVPNRGTEVV